MPSTVNGRVWFNIKEAQAACDVSRRTIYNWLNAGKLVTRRTAGGTLRIAADSLFVPDQLNPQKVA